MPNYIQLQEHSKLKLANCVNITPQEANSQRYNNCLVVDNQDTAKAITCLLGNIDRTDNPLDFILRLADIITNIQGTNITLNTIIQYLNNGSLNTGNNYQIISRQGVKGNKSNIHI